MLFFSCCKPIHQPAERPAESQDRDSGSIKTLDVDLSRSVKERRILQRAPLQITADGKTCTGSSRSLFEASAYRVATHEERARQQLNQPDEDDQGIPQMFLDAYVSALQEGNTQWANSPEVSDLFSDDVKMTGQDKKTTEGKTQVLRRLNKGIEMLIQMAGKDAAVPKWDISGPKLTAKKSHEFRCTIRRGAMRLSFSLDFVIVRGKITQLTNTRL